MYLKNRKASTDPRVRSLLQKAARRGYSNIVDCTIDYLYDIGDNSWLRSRTAVITFEECWPLGGSLLLDRGLSSKRNALASVTKMEKQKDAAGLGALAYAFSQGDESMLDCVPDKRTLKLVSEALQRPTEFFSWVAKENESEQSCKIIGSAQRYLPAATWEWDKACILAAAALAIRGEIPSPKIADEPKESFPYWVALDKHTDEGKLAMRSISKQLGTSYRNIIWSSFYCESAKVNSLLPSPWFDAELTWRLRKTDLTLELAEELWCRASPLIKQYVEKDAMELKTLINPISECNSRPTQNLLL